MLRNIAKLLLDSEADNGYEIVGDSTSLGGKLNLNDTTAGILAIVILVLATAGCVIWVLLKRRQYLKIVENALDEKKREEDRQKREEEKLEKEVKELEEMRFGASTNFKNIQQNSNNVSAINGGATFSDAPVNVERSATAGTPANAVVSINNQNSANAVVPASAQNPANLETPTNTQDTANVQSLTNVAVSTNGPNITNAQTPANAQNLTNAETVANTQNSTIAPNMQNIQNNQVLETVGAIQGVANGQDLNNSSHGENGGKTFPKAFPKKL